ncbi:MAG: hypothetical protein BroJett021_33770 [Chloroflexota bacterium]|nr:MAG: hypothetical protein BroJett021_33770 [Chloroflexota bacterium]
MAMTLRERKDKKEKKDMRRPARSPQAASRGSLKGFSKKGGRLLIQENLQV